MALKVRMPQFGRMLREARLDRGLGQKDVAKKTGFTLAYVSEIELGKRIIRRGTADRFIRAYRLPRRPTIAAWLEERCRQDQILGRVQGELTFMQHCRRRRIELGLGQLLVKRAARIELANREAGKLLPPGPKKARALLRVLRLPLRLVALAEAERIAHRKALFLPAESAEG